MLFNSNTFIFLFFPLTLAGFFLLGPHSRNWALRWLILASLVFYTWWRPLNILLITPSILINFGLARLLQKLQREEKAGAAKAVLLLGIAFNIAFLGYFKYTNFLVDITNDAFGTNFVLANIILPLGISFITFQKIAFLVDVHSRRVEEFTLQDYGLFVLFFPQLIAGPIVHYREMMPQFQRNSCRMDSSVLTIGLTLFCFGLFKKVVLADSMATHVTPIYELAASSGTVPLLSAWVSAIGFTLQLYFDFSGYSDMAAGLAFCFGIRLPMNFYSPLQASSIIDFWSRWHLTLTRFLTAYLYNPLTLWLTRRRLATGRPGLGGRTLRVGAFLQLLAGPTLLTMFISGVWHGAGYGFALWGLLHGVLLSINHAWRLTVPKLWSSKESYARVMRPIGFVLTLVSVVFGMVLFRAPTVHTAMTIFKGMLGFNGIEFPTKLLERLGGMQHLVTGIDMPLKEFFSPHLVAGALLAIALLMPNTLQIMARVEPVLGIKERPANTGMLPFALAWKPTLLWAIAIAVLTVTAVTRLGGPSEFLYWQF